MQLTNGLYIISTIATSPWGERWVQRNQAEDRTVLPKRVAVQPIGVVPYQVCFTMLFMSQNSTFGLILKIQLLFVFFSSL